jgi:hypothetical protein
MVDHAKRRRAAKRAAENVGLVRQPLPTMTSRLMLAARKAGTEAVRYSDALSGTRHLKETRPHGFHNPLSEHFEDRHMRVYGRSSDARNPIDHQAEQAAKLHAMVDVLRTMGLVR